jgi:hypothetical protein
MPLADIHRRNTTAGDLARVAVLWLALILLVQGQAALWTLVRGPAHRHLPLAQWPHSPADRQGPGGTMVQAAAAHQAATDRAASDDAHRRAHEQGRAHHHAADIVVVPADHEAALDAAAFLLVSALLALGFAFAWRAGSGQSPLRAAPAVPFASRTAPPPRRPPRG